MVTVTKREQRKMKMKHVSDFSLEPINHTEINMYAKTIIPVPYTKNF